jgi:hypothetical protein
MAVLLVCVASGAAASDESDPERENEIPKSRRSTGVDAALLAPIGVVDSYALEAGEFGFSYRYSYVHFDDMRKGTERRSTQDVLQGWDETPRKRDLQRHLFGVAWAPHRRVTLSAELPVFTQETHVVARGTPNQRFETESEGVGDLQLRALVPFMRKRNESLQIEFGLTAPTGSIYERDRGADGSRQRLPFPQQLGSGTVDILLGGTYRGRWETLSWGLVTRSTFRTYENSRNYKLGNEYEISVWLAQSWTDWMSTSLRMAWNRRDNVHPRDDTRVDPELDPKRQAGDVLDIGPGVNFRLPWLGEPRFGVEMTWPYYQNLEGPQLERDWQVTTGWKWAF